MLRLWKDHKGMIAMKGEFVGAAGLQELTGIKASTWRYWAMTGFGPVSFKIGRRRMWKTSEVLEWIDGQRASTSESEATTS